MSETGQPNEAVPSDRAIIRFYSKLKTLSWDDGGEQIANYVLRHPAYLSQRTSSGRTLLQVLLSASRSSRDMQHADQTILRILDRMDERAISLPNAKTDQTPLVSAIREKRTQIIQKLIQRDVPRHRALHIAISETGDLDVVKAVFACDPTLIYNTDSTGAAPLNIACASGRVDIALFLATHGPESLQMTTAIGTPLHIAIFNGHMEIVKLLLGDPGLADNTEDHNQGVAEHSAEHSAGKDVNLKAKSELDSKGHFGRTPLIMACVNEQLSMAEFLLAHGADPQPRDKNGDTALTASVDDCHVDFVHRLLQNETVRKTIDDPGRSGETALMKACARGNPAMVSLLLEAGADCTAGGDTDRSPLEETLVAGHAGVLRIMCDPKYTGLDAHNAMFHSSKPGHVFRILQAAFLRCGEDTVKVLLECGMSLHKADIRGRTPLHLACGAGYKDFVEFILNNASPAIDVDLTDGEGWTALHHASWSLRNEQSQMPEDKVVSSDEASSSDELDGPHDGAFEFLKEISKQALPDISNQSHDEVVNYLLSKGANPHLSTNKNETAFHLVARRGHVSRLVTLLCSVHDYSSLVTTLAVRDSSKLTPLGCALFNEHPRVIRQLLKATSLAADSGGYEEKSILWLARDSRTHDLLSLLLSAVHKSNTTQATIISNLPRRIGARSSALEWAAFAGYPKTVWWILFSSDPSVLRDRYIESAESIAHHCLTQLMRGNLHPQRASTIDGRALHFKEQTDLSDRWTKIISILQDPPETMVHPYRQPLKRSPGGLVADKPSYPPHLSDLLNSYKAEVVLILDNTFLRRLATLKDVIYDVGPRHVLYKNSIERATFHRSFGTPGDSITEKLTRSEHQVLWVHLPANNMQWMEDLTHMIKSDDFRWKRDLDWLRQTYEQTQDKQDRISFMKHKCIASSAESDSTLRAVYMPYMAPGIYRNDGEASSQTYQLLLRRYCEIIVHGAATLDEFYYHLCDGEDIESSMYLRNRDQVLSKTIHKSLDARDSWILLNIDQIWIWVLDENTIITSSTHRKDAEVDPLSKAVLEFISTLDATSDKRPENAFQMCELIINICVDFFNRKLEMSTGPREKPWQGSIKDTFGTAITQAAIGEVSLYNSFASRGRKESNEGQEMLGRDANTREILHSANLFREVKDIRDELKMLKTVAEYQHKVQKEFARLHKQSRLETVSSSEVIDSISEMDKAAERIETAVNTTLNLQQNEISISQANEAVRQGRIFMIFTVVTILFLPLSFFTSLFALQVETFLQTPSWAFIVMFCASFVISAPLAIYAFYSDAVMRQLATLLDLFKRTSHAASKDEKLPAWSEKAGSRSSFLTGSFQGLPTKRHMAKSHDEEAS